MFLGIETLQEHRQIHVPYNPAFKGLQAFRMYGGIGMPEPYLHRESTDTLI